MGALIEIKPPIPQIILANKASPRGCATQAA